jgi:hypothetical protein
VSAKIVSEVSVDVPPVVLVGRVDRAEHLELDTVLLEQLAARRTFVAVGLPRLSTR